IKTGVPHPVLGKMKASGLEMPDISELTSSDGPFRFASSEAAKYVFLQEQGKLPRLYNAKVEPEIQKAAKAKTDETIERLASDFYRSQVEKSNDLGRSRAHLYFDDDGNLKRNSLREFKERVLRYRQNNGKDLSRFKKDIDKRLRQPALRKKYDTWAKEQF